MHLITEDEFLRILTLAENDRTTFLHVLACPRCRQRIHELLELSAMAEAQEPLDSPQELPGPSPLLKRTLDAAADSHSLTQSSAALTAHLAADLLALPPHEQLAALEKRPDLQAPAFAHHLLDEGERLADDPHLAGHYAQFALSLLERLAPFPSADSCRTRALLLLADAKRQLGLVEIADDTLSYAAHTLGGELTSLDHARFCACLALLRMDQDRPDEALALFYRAAALFEVLGEWKHLAATRLAQGWLLLEEECPGQALHPLTEALSLTDPSAEPELTFATLHPLALALADLGRTESLRETLDTLSDLKLHLPPGPLYSLRRRWIRAQTHWRLGEHDTAIDRLGEVVKGLVGVAPSHEVAVAALELAHWGLSVAPRRTHLLESLHRLLTLLASSFPSSTWEVIDFALTFPRHLRGSYLTLLLHAKAYIARAQLNPALPFSPGDPHDDADWDSLAPADRIATAHLAGVILDAAFLPVTERDRRLLAWAHETLTGLRLAFVPASPAPDPAGLSDDLDPPYLA